MKFIKLFTMSALAFAAIMFGVNNAQATHYNNVALNSYNGYNNAFTYAYPVQQLVQVKAYPVYQAYPVAAPVAAQPIQYQAPTASDICNQTYNQAQFQAPVQANNHCVIPVAAPVYQQAVAVQKAVNYVPLALVAKNNYSGFGHGFNAFRSRANFNYGHRNAVQIVNPYGFRRNNFNANNHRRNVVAVRNNFAVKNNRRVAVVAVRNNGHFNNAVRLNVQNNHRRNVVAVRNNGHFNNAVRLNVQNNHRNAQRIVVRQRLLGQRRLQVRQNNSAQQRIVIRQGLFGRRVIINNR